MSQAGEVREADTEAAYGEGRRAAERKASLDDDPYPRSSEQSDAWRSGWIDRTNQLKRLKADV